jgi:hypothetical protein
MGGLAVAAMIFVIGCGGPRPRPAVDQSMPQPIPPAMATASAGLNNGPDWSLCRQPRSAQANWPDVTEMILTYVTEGNDFREPAEPNGYLLRVIPLNKNYRPAPVTAQIHIGLFRNPLPQDPQERPRPIRYWFLNAEQLTQYWRKDAVLDGYLLPLDWGDAPPAQGSYLFLAVINDPAKPEQAVCQQISFQDTIKRPESAPKPTADTPPSISK